MTKIDVDFDIYQLITLERRGFDEPENTALRRLLGLDQTEAEPTEMIGESVADAGRPWNGKGVILPHGTKLKMTYRGREISGLINDGRWEVDGVRSTSPSDAASKAAVTKDGNHPSLNGWIYWQVLRPGDTAWKLLATLRRR